MTRFRILLLVGIGFVLIVNVVSWFSRPRAAVPGPSGSTYSTLYDGTAAFYELLGEMDRPTSQLRRSLARQPLPQGSTLFVIEAGFWQPSEAEVEAVQRHLDKGGRLVLTGYVPGSTLEELTGVELEQSFTSDVSFALADPEGVTENVFLVQAAGLGAYRDAETVVIGTADSALLVEPTERVLLLADASVLSNQFIGQADNAQLALNLVQGGEAVFYEYLHGYGQGELFGALPERWQWFLGLGLAALLITMLALSRRLGTPERIRRDLAPARSSYVEALGSLLARTRQPGSAAAPLRAAIKARLSEQSLSEGDLRARALSRGLEPASIDSILGSEHDPETLLRLDHSLAQLTRGQP